jgi:DNA invertase Pin-like site-specific DNA recombinase
MWQMIGILAVLERSLIQERTKAGKAEVVRGAKMGSKSKLTLQQATHAKKLIEQVEHHDTVAKSLNVSQ